MNKRFFLITSLVCLAATLNNAIPSPKKLIQDSCKAVYGCGKSTCDKVWSHKYAALFTSAVIVGGVIVYNSEMVQKFIKELLGVEDSKPNVVFPKKNRIDGDGRFVQGSEVQECTQESECVRTVRVNEIEEDETLEVCKSICPCETEEADEVVNKIACSCEDEHICEESAE